MRNLKNILAVITGNAVIITKKSDNRADISIGSKLTTQFAVSSMVGAVKSLML